MESGSAGLVPLDLAPACWVWLPCGRTLPNTVVRFAREFVVSGAVQQASGWILADSRYRLWVNGVRIQFGPSPADPRWPQADPLDLAPWLRSGTNRIEVEVVWFGHGDGTWADGNPGFICQLAVIDAAGQQRLDSGLAWQCALDRRHRPGQFAQWFLRAWQEEVDARATACEWLTPRILAIPAHRSSLFPHQGSQFDQASSEQPNELAILPRMIPLMLETVVSCGPPVEQGRVLWTRDPDDWFHLRIEGSLRAERATVAERVGEGWRLPPTPSGVGWFLTFALPEHAVGWPRLTVTAAAGTVIEVLWQEGHDPAGDQPWLDTHFCSWFRWTCADGVNQIEPFDFMAGRWLQMHVHAASAPVDVCAVGLRRRLHPFPQPAVLRLVEPALQALVEAGLNTLRNSAQEIIGDGFGRERQQYSGDCGHQMHAARLLHGATALGTRYLRTWSDGQCREGWFLDCWPGYDRLKRVMQRQLGTTVWGPILDHGVGFAFDTWHHLLESGDADGVALPQRRLQVFADWLWQQRDSDGLLPADGYGVPSVWMDHEGFHRQRDKRLAFTLYAAAAFADALAPLARHFGETSRADDHQAHAAELVAAAVRHHWCPRRRIFIDNLPWESSDGAAWLHDRTLATAILHRQNPDADDAAGLAALVTCPPEMGFSYPANAGWRLWALGAAGRADVILNDLRHRWASMPSVRLNNSLSENWNPKPDSCDQWSHCPVAPLYVLVQEIAGIRPTAPGFARCRIRPQMSDLSELAVSVRTPHGDLVFAAQDRRVTLVIPQGIIADVVWGGSVRTLHHGRHVLS